MASRLDEFGQMVADARPRNRLAELLAIPVSNLINNTFNNPVKTPQPQQTQLDLNQISEQWLAPQEETSQPKKINRLAELYEARPRYGYQPSKLIAEPPETAQQRFIQKEQEIKKEPIPNLIQRFGRQAVNEFANIDRNLLTKGHVFTDKQIEPYMEQAAKDVEQMGWMDKLRYTNVLENYAFHGGIVPVGQIEKNRARMIAAEKLLPNLPVEERKKGEYGKLGVDVSVGLGSFIVQLMALRKVLPAGTPETVIWEMQNQMTGGVPGQGAVTRSLLGEIGKIPTTKLPGKILKTGAESGLFAGITAATGGNVEDIIVSSLVPVAFNGWTFAQQQKYISDLRKGFVARAEYDFGKRQSQINDNYKAEVKRIKEVVTDPVAQQIELGKAAQRYKQMVRGNETIRNDYMNKAQAKVDEVKRMIYSDDAFAPAKEKWAIERQRALKMIASGDPAKVRKGQSILDWLEVHQPQQRQGIAMPTTRAGEFIERIRGQGQVPTETRPLSAKEVGVQPGEVTGRVAVQPELPGQPPKAIETPSLLSEQRKRAEEKLKKKVTQAKVGKAEGPLVAQLYTQMEDLLEQAQKETDFDKRNAILDRMEKIDGIIGQLSRENLEGRGTAKLFAMAKRFGVELPKGAKREDIINALAGRADLSQIQKTPEGYQIKVPLADNKAGRGWEIRNFDTYAEAVDFLEEREGGAPAGTKSIEGTPSSLVETEKVEGQQPPAGAVEEEVSAEKPQTIIREDMAPIEEIPLEDLVLSEDVQNFKEGANPETGIVPGQELKGEKYVKTPARPIVVWERKDGTREIITGRHRVEFARRLGEKTIPGQIVRESEGFTEEMALIIDAESNIMDEQGSVRDYAHYFRNTETTEEEARQRGLLSRSKGNTGFRIGKSASDDVYTAYVNGKLSEAKAYAIANGAPNNEAAQNAALQKADSKSADELEQYARILSRYETKPISGKEGDLFGYDDSAIKEAEAVAAEVAKEVKSVKDRIFAVKGALRRPETAREMGLEFTDEDSIRAEVSRLEERLEALKRTSTTPELYAEMRKRSGLTGEAPELAKAKPSEKKEAPVEAPPSIEKEPTRLEKGQQQLVTITPKSKYSKIDGKWYLQEQDGKPENVIIDDERTIKYLEEHAITRSQYAEQLFKEKEAAKKVEEVKTEIKKEPTVETLKNLTKDARDRYKSMLGTAPYRGDDVAHFWFEQTSGHARDIQQELIGAGLVKQIGPQTVVPVRIKEKPAPKPAPEKETVSEQPANYITPDEKDQLKELGYSVKDILNMTPAQARTNIRNRTPEIRQKIKHAAPKLTDAQVDGILALWTANAKVNNMTLPEWIDKNIAEIAPGAMTGKKAMIQFQRDGKAIITAFKNADISSFIHETAHIFRRMMTPEQDAIIRKAFGITTWDTMAEEKFARAFERYIYEGKAPSPEVRGIFNKLAQWLREIYKFISSTSPLNINISPEIRNVFDNFLRKDIIEPYGKPAEQPAAEGGPAFPGPTGRTGRVGQRAGEKGTAKYIGQSEAARRGEQPEIPAGSGPVIQNREDLPAADKTIVDDLLNKYGGPRDSTLYQADQGPALDEHQIYGISLALKAIGDGRSFLLADGTGFGKTRQCIVVAYENQTRTKKPSLIVTQNKEVIKTAFFRQAEILGIDMKKIEIGTYTGLNKGIIGNKKYRLVIFDESHNLKNFESGKSITARKINTDTKMFVTATPMDKHTSAAYFLSEISGVPMQEMMNRLGFHIERRTDPYTQKTFEYTVTNEGVSWADVIDHIIDMRNQSISNGTYLRREMPFKGVVRPFEIAMPNDFRVRQDDIYGYWEFRIKRARSREMKMRLGQIRSGELSRFTESQKVRPVLQAVLNDLQNGQKVIVVAEGINPTNIKALQEIVPGFIGTFTHELDKQNIKYAKIYGGGNKAREIDKFQNDEVQIAVMTPQSGGTGVDLDDTIGNNPRKMYIVSMSWAGDQFEQTIGRVSRRNTRSDSEVRIVRGRSISDDKRMSTAERKLRTLTAIQRGEDLDRSGGIEIIDENGQSQILYQDETKPWDIEQRDKSLTGKFQPPSAEELKGGLQPKQGELFDKEKFLTLKEREKINAKRDIKGQGTLFQEETPWYYSKLERAVFDKMPNKMTAEAFRNWAKKQGVKDEEMLWSGVDELLSKKESVSKQDILDTIAANNIQLEEVVKGGVGSEKERTLHTIHIEQIDIQMRLENARRSMRKTIDAVPSDLTPEQRKRIGMAIKPELYIIQATNPQNHLKMESDKSIVELRKIFEGIKGINLDDIQKLNDEYRELQKERIKLQDEIEKAGGQTQFNRPDLVLPGGTNYREVLMRLPEIAEARTLEEKFRESSLTEEEFERVNELRSMGKEPYKSPHWSETNVLAHFRLTDRTDKAGNKVLFIEEIQSDWHQQGREKGYKKEPTKEDAKDLGYSVYRAKSNLGTEAYFLQGPSRNLTNVGFDKEEDAWKSLLQYIKSKNEGVPNAPFKTTWPELAFKRIVRMAAEEGYDKVAWTTGEQQAERYDLSKYVEKVEVDKQKNDIYNLVVYEKGKSYPSTDKSVSGKDLADYVGKELAEKISKQESGWHTYDNLDLKVGGEGMKGFYDRIIPSFAKKYLKKFGVKGVGETTILVPDEAIPAEKRVIAGSVLERHSLEVHSIPITDSMKESVLAGQPLYQSEELSDQDKENIRKTFNMLKRHSGKKKAQKVWEQVQQEKKLELRRRVGRLAGMQQGKRGNYENTIFSARAALPGELTEYAGRFVAVRDKLKPEIIDSCFKSIQVSGMRPFQIDGTADAFKKFIDGHYLTLREVNLIYKHFGPAWGRLALRNVPLGDKLWLDLMEALNIPRTMLASFDMSGILRQARPLGQAHPKEYAQMMKHYWQTFWSHNAAMKLEAATIADPFYEEAKSDRILELVEWGETVPEMIERAERFGGAGIIERAAEVPIAGIPLKPIAMGVRASERSFVTALNWMRMAVYSKIRAEQERSGKYISLSERKALASRINDLTGRSHIKRSSAARSLAPFMQALFSPRFTLSRFKPLLTLPKDAIMSIKNGKLRSELKLGTTALISLIMTNFLIMFILKLLDKDDKIELEYDLQSSDGGKIKIGNSRMDLWSGYLQPAQLMVRLATGQRKTQAGDYRQVSRGQILEDFGRSKANPIVGLVIDAYTGRTFYGGRFGGPPKGKPGEVMTKYNIPDWVQGVGKETWNRTIPLVIQDTADALADSGVPMATTLGILSFFGGGAQTYPMWASTQLKLEQDKLSKQKYNKPWNELNERQQDSINRRPNIKRLQIEKKKERIYEGPPQIDWMLAEQDKISKDIQKSLPQNVQSKMKELGIAVSAPSRRLGDFYLNDKRYEFYISETRKNMINIFKKGVPKSEKIFRQRMDLAKEKARIQLRKMIKSNKL